MAKLDCNSVRVATEVGLIAAQGQSADGNFGQSTRTLISAKESELHKTLFEMQL